MVRNIREGLNKLRRTDTRRSNSMQKQIILIKDLLEGGNGEYVGDFKRVE
jgi:hypothetical protein